MTTLVSPLLRRWEECGAPLPWRLASLQEPGWITDRLTQAAQRWPGANTKTLGYLWWYSTSHNLVGTCCAHWLVHGTVPCFTAGGRCALNPADGYLCGLSWEAHVDDLMRGGADLADFVRPIITALSYVSGAPEQGLWAIAADAVVMQAASIAGESGAETSALVVRSAVEFYQEWRRTAPLPPMSSPHDDHPVTWPRQSCCQLYRVPGQKNCRNCPKCRR